MRFNKEIDNKLIASVYLSCISANELDKFDNTHLICQCVKVLNAQPLTYSTHQYKSVTQNDGHTYLVQTAHGIVQRAYKVHSIDTVEEGGILINFETYKNAK